MSKAISVTDKLYNQLSSMKKKGQSFTGVIQTLLDERLEMIAELDLVYHAKKNKEEISESVLMTAEEA